MANRHTFVFFYQDHSKKEFVLNDNPLGAALSELKDLVCSLFKIQGKNSFFLQAWDTTFDAFVDVGEDEITAGGVKINAVQCPMQVEQIIPVQLDRSLVSEVFNQSDAHSGDQRGSWTDIDQPSAAAANVQDETSDNDQQMVMGSDEDDENQNHRSTSVSNAGRGWTTSYKLPNLPLRIHTKLMQLPAGNDLKVAERTVMLELIFKSVTKHTYYPTSGQYGMIIDLLFQRYPHLGQASANMSFGNQKTLWKTRLTYTFQNCRDKMKKDINTQVTFRKRKANLSTNARNVSATPPRPQWGVSNYLPKMPSSEDENSCTSHIEWMKEEKNKRYPDINRIGIAMLATLSSRREMIVTNHAKVTQVAELYPWLFEETQLLAEMDRLIGEKERFQQKMEAGFSKYGMAIVKYGKQLKSKSTPQCFKDMADKIPVQRNADDYQEAVTRASILLIPTMFREKIENMFQTKNQEQGPTLSPVIKCDSGSITTSTVFETMVDGVVVTTSSDVIHAFYCYIACIYAFNLYNPKAVEKSALFVEKVILQLEDNQPIQPLLSIVTKLNNLL